MKQTWLYAYGSNEPVAWSDDGCNFFSPSTGGPFAWREDEWLYAYEGGRPMGWFQGDTFYRHPGATLIYYVGRS